MIRANKMEEEITRCIEEEGRRRKYITRLEERKREKETVKQIKQTWGK